MTFASVQFGLLLVTTLALYYFLPRYLRILMLLASSYVFYCYWNPVYGFLILVSTLIDYIAALVIESTTSAARKRLALAASVVGNLGMLGYFKYTNFALDNLRLLLGPLAGHVPGHLDIILPAGISFYTFQTMSYTIDVFRGTQRAERDFFVFALYVSFFPQLVAGPIERASDLLTQLKVKQPFRAVNLEAGARLFLWGLVKKLVVSDRIAFYAMPMFRHPEAFHTPELLFAAMAMFVTIYLDFSAYSDMARGTARMFGVHLSVNFLKPLSAGNIGEFWRRWHITMSTWVRDYVYMPLGGFRPRHPWTQLRTTLVTMTLVGLWHGAQWTYVIWGFSHGAMMSIYQYAHLRVFRRYKHHPLRRTAGWSFASWLFTYLCVSTSAILFFSPSLGQAALFFQRLYLRPQWAGLENPTLQIGYAALAIFLFLHHVETRRPFVDRIALLPVWPRAAVYTLLTIIACTGAVYTSLPFIYFQF